jgi:hypothetical protein
MKISQTGVGVESHPNSIRDSSGTSLLPVQAQGDGATTFRVLGRVSPDAPWVEIIAAGTADFLQAVSWVPYMQLEVTSGTGTVDLWIAEK